MSVTYAAGLHRPAPRGLPKHAASVETARDRTTVDRLAGAVAGATPLRFDPAWWDGAATSRCLIIRLGSGRRRVVENCGRVVVLPAAAWRARAALRRWRTGTAPVPVVAEAVAPVFDGARDVLTCERPGCGGLRGLDAVDGRCPVCRC